jgi:HlyD family secretion protein
VTATGTLQPTKSVNIGSELSGTLVSVLVEENDHVKKGQILAKLDTAKLQDAVAKSKAALSAAQATVALAEATVVETKANLSRMRRVAKLSGGKVPAESELETAIAAVERAKANTASARSTVLQTQATLNTDETNLTKGIIRSPINGVVLSRNVEPGQTVAASMSTPILFTLAEDLKTMELEVKVDEADVGNVRLGQKATFTVSTWSGRKFPATIKRVGIGSTITDNVVTYKTILTVRNDDLALRPGMTANATIVTAMQEKALLVPNAALRFAPPLDIEPKPSSSFVFSLLPRPPHEIQHRKTTQSLENPQVWILVDSKPKAIPVELGINNDKFTEILSGNLKVGDVVIIDYEETK